MDKRTIIGLALIGVILVFSMWYSQSSRTAVEPDKVEEENFPIKDDTELQAPVDKAVDNSTLSAFPDTVSDSISISDVYILTEDMEIILTTGGADIKSAILLDHTYDNGKRINLVPEMPGERAYSSPNFDIDLMRGKTVYTASSVHFQADRDTLILKGGDSTGVVTFMGYLPDGSPIQRRYEFYRDGYRFHHSFMTEAENAFEQSILWWRKGMSPTEKNIKADLAQFRFAYMMGGSVEREKFKKKDDILLSPDGSTQFVATHSKYFIAILAPREGEADGARAKGLFRQKQLDEEFYDIPQIGVGLYNIHTQNVIKEDFFVYLGPSDYNIIKEYGDHLQKAVDLGWAWLEPVTKIILSLFNFLYGFIGNYGFVILLFTLLMKLILTPLMAKQLKSQQDMQRLQPKIKNLQEKYRDNPEKLNKETMELYKRHGVNPLGGCLPMLLQMPIFFALYRALSLGFQFRGAKFIWWIKDLSSPDPYMVLPIIMAVTMFVQQKMTVKDPKQKMMVYIFPIFFLFLFRNMPAGLVLYWTFYNMLTVAHTAWMNRNTKEEENE